MNFPRRLHTILSDDNGGESRRHTLSWQPDGKGFVIHNRENLVRTILPVWFRISKWASFQRQLNLYGFKNTPIGLKTVCYYHEFFLRDNLGAITCIQRTAIKGAWTQRINPKHVSTLSKRDKPQNKKHYQHAFTLPKDQSEDRSSSSNPAIAKCSESINDLCTRKVPSIDIYRRDNLCASINEIDHNVIIQQKIQRHQLASHPKLKEIFSQNKSFGHLLDQDDNYNSFYTSEVQNAIATKPFEVFKMPMSNLQQAQQDLLFSSSIAQLYQLINSPTTLHATAASANSFYPFVSQPLVHIDESKSRENSQILNWSGLAAEVNLSHNISQQSFFGNQEIFLGNHQGLLGNQQQFWSNQLGQSKKFYLSSMNERFGKQMIENQLRQQFQNGLAPCNGGFDRSYTSENAIISAISDILCRENNNVLYK